MTKQEVTKILAILRAAYPAFYRSISRQDAQDAIDLWAALFVEDDPQLVTAAIKAFIASDERGYPPAPGQIKAKMRLLSDKPQPGEAEAWAMVMRAVRNGFYGAREEFARLSPVVQRIVGSPAQIREWSQISPDELETVIASNFQRSYRTAVQQEREIAALPSDARALREKLIGANKAAQLPGGNEKSRLTE